MDSAPPNAATDQPADGAGQARVCARPDCSNPALKGPTGRLSTYCSRSCRGKVDRAKAKAREAAAAEAAAPAAAARGLAAPEPAAAPTAAAPDLAASAAAALAAAVPADNDLDRWGEDGRYLLSLADALRRKLTRFLEETENGDPVAAFKELTLTLPGYSSRVFATAQDIRDKARWPDLTENERINRRVAERTDLWGDDAGRADDDQGQNQGQDQDQDQDDDGSASRGETAAADEEQEQLVPAEPAAAEPAPPVVLPRRQDDDPLRPPPEPYLRGLDRYDLIRNASTFLGSGWDLVGWSWAPDLFFVRKDGRALGWIEYGAARVNGWAVLVGGTFLVDSNAPDYPLACDTADDAALLVCQALEQGLIDAAGLVRRP
ncbi:hypothetical protein [Streptomyces sp. NRRL S-350]|uniref:hypothetical protein n=1 Tax=Streptomyces sp. NRRL S-350 TaxID=1463902 RepID=UPI0004C112DE|nr:hypothetical protein [Streptomyces sp. NRRL S-350]